MCLVKELEEYKNEVLLAWGKEENINKAVNDSAKNMWKTYGEGSFAIIAKARQSIPFPSLLIYGLKERRLKWKEKKMDSSAPSAD